MEGYNAVSAFGTTPEQTIQDRIDSIKNRTAPQTEASKNNIKDLEKAKNKITGEAITADDAFKETGDYDGPSVETGPVGSQFEDQSYADPGVDAEENQPDGANESSGSSSSTPDASSAPSRGGGQDMGGAEASGSSSPGSQANSPGNPANQGAPSSASPSNPYGGGEGGVQSGLDSPDVGETSSDAGFEDQSYSGPPSQSSGGGGGGGGGGKIVCTMMNNSYGFGSFRNKIWLKHSKNMAPEYQIGYHKIFLPLIKIAKTNKVVKKVLEHIAVHRTIDIRQESRGKTHLLGRVYRKILEPICYLVGKYAK